MADNAANNAAPSLNALAQYCKDFSFENPNAPRSLQQQAEGPQINLQVNVNAKQLASRFAQTHRRETPARGFIVSGPVGTGKRLSEPLQRIGAASRLGLANRQP